MGGRHTTLSYILKTFHPRTSIPDGHQYSPGHSSIQSVRPGRTLYNLMYSVHLGRTHGSSTQSVRPGRTSYTVLFNVHPGRINYARL